MPQWVFSFKLGIKSTIFIKTYTQNHFLSSIRIYQLPDKTGYNNKELYPVSEVLYIYFVVYLNTINDHHLYSRPWVIHKEFIDLYFKNSFSKVMIGKGLAMRGSWVRIHLLTLRFALHLSFGITLALWKFLLHFL